MPHQKWSLGAVVLVFLLGCSSVTEKKLGDSLVNQQVEVGGSTYRITDISPFSPSAAIYFMDGYSEATVEVHSTGQKMTFRFRDENSSIASSAPRFFDENLFTTSVYVPAPPPLSPRAFFPLEPPDEYLRKRTVQILQVISMNMRDQETGSRLLIGLPYAEHYPRVFFSLGELGSSRETAASYGAVVSLTNFDGLGSGKMPAGANGYPARSFFDVLHILETPLGTFFNKKPTRMELQPDQDGKFALALPPIPFRYHLINGPIPLYSLDDPLGGPVASIVAAAHGSDAPSLRPSLDSWPIHQPDLDRIQEQSQASVPGATVGNER
jgi:hypothetical protein